MPPDGLPAGAPLDAPGEAPELGEAGMLPGSEGAGAAAPGAGAAPVVSGVVEAGGVPGAVLELMSGVAVLGAAEVEPMFAELGAVALAPVELEVAALAEPAALASGEEKSCFARSFGVAFR